jgi:hypothetical protein
MNPNLRIALAVAMAALCAACSGSVVQSVTAAGPADAGLPDAAVAEASDAGGPILAVDDAGTGALDAGTAQTSPADAGAIAEEPDAGSAAPVVACSLADATPVWSLLEDLDQNGNGIFYISVSSDSAGGLFVRYGTNAGNASSLGWFTASRDGERRPATFVSEDCQPATPCSSQQWTAAGGFVAGSSGSIESPIDGSVLASWDGALPPEASGSSFPFPLLVATDGKRVVFAVSDDWSGSRMLVTELDSAGRTIWQRVFADGYPYALAIDEAGTTHLAFAAMNIGLDATGQTLFTQPMPALDFPRTFAFAAGGGRLYRAERTLVSAFDGSPSTVLPFEPHGPASLSASRMLVRAGTDLSNGLAEGPLAAMEPSSGAILWEREMRAGDYSIDGLFSENGQYVMVIDPQDVLHFVQEDGSDALACALPPNVSGPGVLLPGGRLVFVQDGSLVAFDLPLKLEP